MKLTNTFYTGERWRRVQRFRHRHVGAEQRFADDEIVCWGFANIWQRRTTPNRFGTTTENWRRFSVAIAHQRHRSNIQHRIEWLRIGSWICKNGRRTTTEQPGITFRTIGNAGQGSCSWKHTTEQPGTTFGPNGQSKLEKRTRTRDLMLMSYVGIFSWGCRPKKRSQMLPDRRVRKDFSILWSSLQPRPVVQLKKLVVRSNKKLRELWKIWLMPARTPSKI